MEKKKTLIDLDLFFFLQDRDIQNLVPFMECRKGREWLHSVTDFRDIDICNIGEFIEF